MTAPFCADCGTEARRVLGHEIGLREPDLAHAQNATVTAPTACRSGSPGQQLQGFLASRRSDPYRQVEFVPALSHAQAACSAKVRGFAEASQSSAQMTIQPSGTKKQLLSHEKLSSIFSSIYLINISHESIVPNARINVDSIFGPWRKRGHALHGVSYRDVVSHSKRYRGTRRKEAA
ncbi:hypothetical protein [Methylobacterium gnaphalii]|uniref:hypothetical protein n=1 Tax=Methylobacterium gnaphalii TaxID=1010610 RepID=UPI0011BEEBB7|nr:hypothetical protein [Methylobacterium gnaphalii]